MAGNLIHRTLPTATKNIVPRSTQLATLFQEDI